MADDVYYTYKAVTAIISDSHECSYCGSKAAIEADGQVVKDCGTCDKRRYHEPIEGGDA